MLIFSIETSCDETAIAIVKAKKNKNYNFRVLANVVLSQIKDHAKFGGVVPNLSARLHLENIIPCVDNAFKKAKILPKQIDLITVTRGPGLIPALLIGTQTAKIFSYLWQKPLVGIHHIEGHIYANFIKNKISAIFNLPVGRQISNSQFPILCLVVSGGHTQLVLMKKHLNYKIIGETLDDAVGEAFDKTARILGLGYPGGPAISQFAAKWKSEIPNSQPKAGLLQRRMNIGLKHLAGKFQIKFPRPMINSKDFNFSFSGLKTAVLYTVQKNKKLLKNEKFIQSISYEFQQSAIDVLISKTIKAARKYNPKIIMLAGGVSANKELRKQLNETVKKSLHGVKYIMPDIKYSTDNSVMIAVAGYYRWQNMSKLQRKKAFDNWKRLKASANLKL
ncbi:MAG: tRNA (adenosine(37)-N6)-threonylcarbamoyltransferase complex transferase subunit TsaD [Patescibacteria group bacterium]|nr:tRNA (adenosine(37)-N6)-threonylcarbamoyltransferase complex transferase subunit TsaD [Patescibacteria group bacterium]